MAAEYWSKLPEDLLISIAERLLSLEDLFAFGAVCTTWRAAKAASSLRTSGPHKAPWLVSFRGNNKLSKHVEIDSLSQHQTCRIGPSSRILEAETVHSSLGWLLTTSCSTSEVSLFNPLSKAEISLPSLFGYIGKFVLSASPFSSVDYKVIVLVDSETTNCKLTAFSFGFMKIWKPGKVAWTQIRVVRVRGTYRIFSDVVYHDGLVWAVEASCSTFVALNIEDIASPVMLVRILMPDTDMSRQVWDIKIMFYVVESEGEILVVRAHREAPDNSCPFWGLETLSFQVYKFRGGGEEFERVLDLGNRALFLGNKTSSFSIKTSDFPNCEANCIYFAEDYTRQCCFSKAGTSQNAVVGIYNLIDGTFKPYLFRFNNADNISDYFLSHLWVQPTLYS